MCSPSVQIINAGLNRALDSGGNLKGFAALLKDMRTTYIAGVRVGVRF